MHRGTLRIQNRLCHLVCLTSCLASVLLATAVQINAETFATPAELGKAFFFDANLSGDRSLACGTCHNTASAFSDPRHNQFGGAVSLGVGSAAGRRNTPTLTYVAVTPEFEQSDNEARGGFFHDGRALTLEDQATQPILSPIEMNLPLEMVLSRLSEHPTYLEKLVEFYGADARSSNAKALAGVGKALAAYQRSSELSTFDSRYDRSLRGEVELTRKEEHGRVLFFSSLLNCSSCHLLNKDNETFTDYTYHNIAVPRHPDLSVPLDSGLAENTHIAEQNRKSVAGKFKVPSLRNVAVTAPYMHNGVFRELETVMEFYNKFLVRRPTNPETGEPWGEPEVAENVSLDLLRQGQPLDEYRIEALTAFMRALTDARYEHLLD